jgi:hyperosmotically inducible periplasmic protein
MFLVFQVAENCCLSLGHPDCTSEVRSVSKGGAMRKLIVGCMAMLLVGSGSFISAAPVDLTRQQRANLEDALLQKLTPLVGVFDYVAFQVDATGGVTLHGQVREATLKTHAAEDAKKVAGVKGVKNQIEVLPLSPTDDGIRRAVYSAIYSQSGFTRYTQQASPPVHIIVKNGSVRLEGRVANKLELAQVNAAAKGVPGVFSVKNNVQVEGAD